MSTMPRQFLGDRLAPGVPFAAAGARSSMPAELRTQTREDPYYSSLFTQSSQAAWSGRALLGRELGFGSKVPRMARYAAAVSALASESDPVTELLRWNRERGLRSLAAIQMWRSLTLPQLAAVTGCTKWARTTWATDVSVLLATGLIQVGELTSLYRNDLPVLLRADSEGDLGPLRDRISFAEWLGVTAGRPWSQLGTHDRHDVLTTEMALRVTQMCPGAGAVLGELLGSHDLIFGVESAKLARRSADAVVVRKDGLRIVLETTATARRVTDKMARWIEMLTADKSRCTVVVFVEAAPPGSSSVESYDEMWRSVHRAVTSSVAAMGAQVLDRMFFVRWSDWFPGPGTVSPDFAVLPVGAFTGTGDAGSPQWRRLDLLDPAAIRFDPAHTPGGARTVLENAPLLMGMPRALVRGTDAAMAKVEQYSLETVGIPTIPVIEGRTG